MGKQDKKTPKEASDIFHNIMKASVTPNKQEKVGTKKFEKKPKSGT